jgi:IS1 family transposase
MASMNKLTRDERARILHLLCEGNSIRAITRLTGVSKTTTTKLVIDAGAAAAWYQIRTFQNLSCRRLQIDEIWGFVGAKAKNADPVLKAAGKAGDAWLWMATDAETKIVPCWHVGSRDGNAAMEFIDDLASRLANRVQITTDGHKAYLDAIDTAFGGQVDYAMLIKLKLYGPSVGSRDGNAAMEFIDDLASRLANRVQITTDGHKAYLDAIDTAFGGQVDYAMLIKLYGPSLEDNRRYSPAECNGTIKTKIQGHPDLKHVSTSYAERNNLNVRMHSRRMTRLTNAFSKKMENHAHAMALHFMYYNFVRIHQTLRTTPAMAAGITKRLWEIGDIVEMLEAWETNNES